jgi:hypothetical protein
MSRGVSGHVAPTPFSLDYFATLVSCLQQSLVIDIILVAVLLTDTFVISSTQTNHCCGWHIPLGQNL